MTVPFDEAEGNGVSRPRCPNCGEPVGELDDQCRSCGADLDDDAPAAVMEHFCPKEGDRVVIHRPRRPDDYLDVDGHGSAGIFVYPGGPGLFNQPILRLDEGRLIQIAPIYLRPAE